DAAPPRGARWTLPARAYLGAFYAGVSRLGGALAFGRGDDPVGRQGAVSAPVAVSGGIARARPVAAVDPERVRRLAADCRPAIAAVLAAAPAAGLARSRHGVPLGRRRDLRDAVSRRLR